MVLVTQGTLNIDARQLLRPALEALADVDVTVLATTGGVPLPFPAPDECVGGRLRAVRCRRSAAASLVISNGGWGGTVETLAAGVPMIVAGGDRDKPEVAARVGYSGAGVNLHTGRPSARAVVRTALRARSWTPGLPRPGPGGGRRASARLGRTELGRSTSSTRSWPRSAPDRIW